MKTIAELRSVLRFQLQDANFGIDYFTEHCQVDFDVFLPSKGVNLQRDFVWNMHQKRELVWSILQKRHIPRISMLHLRRDTPGKSSTFQIIDGKQRLKTMMDFHQNKFTLLIDGTEYFLSELPKEYQRAYLGHLFSCHIVHEDYGIEFTDEEKIAWFHYENFSGTPQDINHLRNLGIQIEPYQI